MLLISSNKSLHSCALLLLAICFHYSCSEASQRKSIVPPNTSTALRAASASLERLHNIRSSGDLSYDFAIMMVAHQQVAIDICNVEMEKGRDPELVEISKKERLVRSRQVSLLEHYIRSRVDIDGVNLEDEQPEDIKNKVGSMTRDMIATGNTGSIDHDFAALLLRHAQFSVEVSRQMLTSGSSGEMQTYADTLIHVNNNLISFLERWQKSQ